MVLNKKPEIVVIVQCLHICLIAEHAEKLKHENLQVLAWQPSDSDGCKKIKRSLNIPKYNSFDLVHSIFGLDGASDPWLSYFGHPRLLDPLAQYKTKILTNLISLYLRKRNAVSTF